MTSISTTAEPRRCLRCGRKLTASKNYGPVCARKIRAANAEADLSAWTASQVDDARELIGDGGVVPGPRPDVFWTVSSNGAEVHLTHRHGCNCPAGLKTRQPHPCYHRAAVVIILSSLAPAAPVRQPLALAA